MRKTFGFILASTVLIAAYSMPASGAEDQSECDEAVRLNSVIFRGALVCGTRWEESKFAYRILGYSQACFANKDTSKAELKRLISEGFETVSGAVKTYGKKAGCAKIKSFIDDIDKMSSGHQE